MPDYSAPVVIRGSHCTVADLAGRIHKVQIPFIFSLTDFFVDRFFFFSLPEFAAADEARSRVGLECQTSAAARRKRPRFGKERREKKKRGAEVFFFFLRFFFVTE